MKEQEQKMVAAPSPYKADPLKQKVSDPRARGQIKKGPKAETKLTHVGTLNHL